MKHFKLLIATTLIILTAASCKKTTYEPPQAVSAIGFFGASPDAPPLSIYLNNSKLDDDSLNYKGDIYYLNAYSGNREVVAYKNGVKKLSQTVKLEDGKIYSCFLTGNYSTAEFVLLEDSLNTPPIGKANIRFVNMSIGAPSLDLGLNDGTTIISGRAYKANSGFITIAGDKQYSFVIREHGSAVNKAMAPAVNIMAGHNYTIWTRGIYTATDGAAMGVDLVLNY
jgi:hypothetical protein